MAKSLEEAFAFSPYTGNRLVNQGGVLVDVETGAKHYLNPKPAVFAVMHRNKGTEVLLVRRGVEPFKGMYDLPGGFMHVDETAQECLRRELKEELDIEIDIEALQFVGTYVDEYPFGGVVQKLINTGFSLEGSAFGNMKVLDDISGHEWVKVEEIEWEMICGKSGEKALSDFMKKGLE